MQGPAAPSTASLGFQKRVDVGNGHRTKRSHPRRQRSREPAQLLVATRDRRRRKALLDPHVLREGAQLRCKLQRPFSFRGQCAYAAQPCFPAAKKELGRICGRRTGRRFEPDAPENGTPQPLIRYAPSVAVNCLRHNKQRPGHTLQRRRRVAVHARLPQESLARFRVGPGAITSDNGWLLE